MLKISMIDEANTVSVKLEGKLGGPWIAEVRKCWEAVVARGSRRVLVDLTAVTFIEGAGKELLRAMNAEGAMLVAGAGVMTRQIVREIERQDNKVRNNQCKRSRGRYAAIILIFTLLLLTGAGPVKAQTCQVVSLIEMSRKAFGGERGARVATSSRVPKSNAHYRDLAGAGFSFRPST